VIAMAQPDLLGIILRQSWRGYILSTSLGEATVEICRDLPAMPSEDPESEIPDDVVDVDFPHEDLTDIGILAFGWVF